MLAQKPIFKNREFLRPTYTPDELPHREEQIKQLARILAAPLRGETPSNIFIYGKTGTGKTATVNLVAKELVKAGERAPFRIEVIYINCEVVNTQYRVLAMLANHLLERLRERRGSSYLKSLGLPLQVPMTGWPTDQVYRCFFKALDQDKQLAVIVLDEIDKLVIKSGDGALYNLTRINSDLERAKVSVVGISNDLNFIAYLDPRVRSSLSEEELIFPPYNALQLKDILERRAKMSFQEGVVEEGVIALCAAHAAREHGDARRALDLLRVAGEVAEAEGVKTVTIEHVKRAFQKIERDKMIEAIRTLPTQSKLVLHSVVLLSERGIRRAITGDVYSVYRALCRQSGVDVLTHRRVSDLISELDLMGVVCAKLVNKGRYGRTKEITLNIPLPQVKEALQFDYSLGGVETLPLPKQLTLPGV